VDQLYLDKTIIRLKDYKNNIDETLYAKLLNIAQESAKYIEKTLPEHMCISHGDLCFSNILNDTRSKSLKLIDPRGLDIDRKLSIYGDIRYDIAKFFHSVIGCYDLIIAGKYKINNDKIDFFIKDLDVLEGLFSEIFLNEFNVSKKEILAINVHLFISMLPLHSDRPDRQKAMIANAYRLYEKLLQEK
jgi:thiamine kinase-like enzyme